MSERRVLTGLRYLYTLALLFSMGCGLQYRVDPVLLRKLPVEYHLRLFDAENDLAIAIDELEQSTDKKRHLRTKLERAEAKISEAEDDQDRASEKKNPLKEKQAQLAEEVARLEVNYWEAKEKLLGGQVATQKAGILLLRARLEEKKAELVVQNNLAGTETINPADYKEQVEDYAKEAQRTKKELQALHEHVSATRRIWEEKRSLLAQKSGGGQGSLFVDQANPWGVAPK